MTSVVAAAGPSAYWYLTRGSGVVALLLLTASLCLGVAGTVRWRTKRLPRFAVAALHRNLSLLSILFVAIHVGTTVLDGYAPIGWKDAVVPFVSPYRPLWLGFGAVAFDLLLALVVTSLLRARIGLRVWRATHWLAYGAWPIALVHGLGSGSDSRLGWFQALAVLCTIAVVGALAIRLTTSNAAAGRRLAAGATAVLALLLVGTWYRGGPGARGWAARAGTPASLIARPAKAVQSTAQVALFKLPTTFTSTFAGNVAESQAGNGLVDVRIDGALRGGVQGRLRLVLEGVPTDGGGVSMTSSGVAFALAGSPVYEGSITSLAGTQVAASVSSGSTSIALRLALDLSGSRVTGTIHGAVA